MPIKHLMKQHARLAVADESKIYDQSLTRGCQGEESNPPPPLTGTSQFFRIHRMKKRKRNQTRRNLLSVQILEVVQIDMSKVRIR